MADPAAAGIADKQSRHRSPNYPQISLGEAVSKVRKIYEADKRAGSKVDVALSHMGFNSKNGSSLGVLSALKKFGLLEEKEGRLFPTQRAVEILNFPETDERYRRAVRDAALYPAIYAELLEQYREGLPSDRALKAELIADKGFNPNVVDTLISAFKDTLYFAGLQDENGLSFDEDNQMVDVEDEPAATVGEAFASELKRGKAVPDAIYGVADKMRGKAAPPATKPISLPVAFDEDGTAIMAHVWFDVPITRELLSQLKAVLSAWDVQPLPKKSSD